MVLCGEWFKVFSPEKNAERERIVKKHFSTKTNENMDYEQASKLAIENAKKILRSK